MPLSHIAEPGPLQLGTGSQPLFQPVHKGVRQIILTAGSRWNIKFPRDALGFFLRGGANSLRDCAKGEITVKKRKIANRPRVRSSHGSKAQKPDAQRLLR